MRKKTCIIYYRKDSSESGLKNQIVKDAGGTGAMASSQIFRKKKNIVFKMF